MDGSSVVQGRESVSTEVLDGEAVIYSSETQAFHVLNPTATIIWQQLDGRNSLDQLAIELSEAFDAPYDVVCADIIEVVRSFAEMGLLEGYASDEPVEGTVKAGTTNTNRGFVPYPASVCDVSVVRRYEWAPTRTVQVGDQFVGIRANSTDSDALLRQLLAAHIADDVEPPYANHSIRIGDPQSTDAPQPLQLLYDGECLVWRSRRASSALAVLLRHLAARVPQVVGGPRIWCAAFRCPDGTALLASTVARRQAARQAAQLLANGVELLPTPFVQFDVSSGEAVLPMPALNLSWDVDGSAVDLDLSDLASSLGEQRFPVRAWVFLSGPGALDPMRRPDALPLAAQALIGEDMPTPQATADLAEVLSATTPIGAGKLNSLELVSRLPELSRQTWAKK